MDGYDWYLFVELLEQDYRDHVPKYIRFKSESDIWVEKEIQKATLDELTTAIVNLNEEIDRLQSSKKMLDEVHKRARQTMQSGSLIVHDAILDHPEPNLKGRSDTTASSDELDQKISTKS